MVRSSTIFYGSFMAILSYVAGGAFYKESSLIFVVITAIILVALLRKHLKKYN